MINGSEPDSFCACVLGQSNRAIQKENARVARPLRVVLQSHTVILNIALFTCWQWLPSRTEDEKRRLQKRVLALQE
jgi:hypothetical protein